MKFEKNTDTIIFRIIRTIEIVCIPSIFCLCSLGFISSFFEEIINLSRIDWRQSLPQIIAAVIGSGPIVTAFLEQSV
ncbi:MAG: hypothetical protein WAM42_05845 [Candidatus Nitrosopolaris sp.]